MQFPKVNPKQSFPQLEEAVLAYWEKEKIFEETLEREAKKDFVFYDGPPFATGLPHYGHILQGVIKDLIPRYKTMKGYKVPRKWGWDCHGLPVENLIEKELGLKNREEIENYGIGKFNEKCRDSVLRYAGEWKKTVKRMGRWIDMENDYKTMDVDFMDSVWWVFHELWEKGLIYEGLKPMHICPRCETPLSNFEVGLGYKDTTDLTAIAKFELEDEENTFVLAWTTTPWTLPGNVALAVGEDIEYVKVDIFNEVDENQIPQYQKVILAKEIFEEITKEESTHFLKVKFIPTARRKHEDKPAVRSNPIIIETLTGKELIKKYPNGYKPLFPYFAVEKNNGGFRIVSGKNLDGKTFVSTTEGTGIVHIAPAFGDDDYNLKKREDRLREEGKQEFGLPIIQHVGMNGKFTKGALPKELEKMELSLVGEGEKRKADREIVKWLGKEKIFTSKEVNHPYPLCWRCESPLLNYATSSWFVNVEKIKKDLLENNQEINWVPAHIRDGRFGKWLEGARDWAISRNRFWGAPLPVWRCDCGETKCISSREELEKLSGKKVTDLHKHFVDEITFKCKCGGGEMKRIPEVLDCWFESGSMPYAQNATKAETKLPADFIAEAQDQTRGWFYTLHVLATALQNKPAFANCICSGLVLAEDGQKMSKSKNNFPPPENIFDKYGADAMRLYLMNSPVVNAQELRFSERGVEETLRSVLLPLWNTYYFFTTYASADGWEGGDLPAKPTNKLDRWILSELNLLIKEMSEKLEAYEIQAALKPLAAFLDGLTNWYIRRSRRRFWRKVEPAPAKAGDGDKEEAYATLLHVLKEVSKLLAPVAPFLAEEIYRGLTGEKSVHLAAWPEVDSGRIDEALSKEVEVTRKIISLGLAIRGREKIKVRQPLNTAKVNFGEFLKVSEDFKNVISEELNVKKFDIIGDPTDLAKPLFILNPKILGSKFKERMQKAISIAKEGKVKEVEEGWVVEGMEDIVIKNDEVNIRWEPKPEFKNFSVDADESIIIALDTTITPELELEGKARDLVRVIQDLRKQADYAVSDRIELQLENAEEILAVWQDYIATETLAESIVKKVENADAEDSLEGVKIGVKKLPSPFVKKPLRS